MITELIEGMRIAFQALRANMLRSLLTTLGVVIGITFVILMGWALKGLDAAFDSMIDSMGTNVLHVDKWDWFGGKRWQDVRNRKDITLEQAQKLMSRLTMAEMAVPTSWKWGASIKYGDENISGVSVNGTWSNYAFVSLGGLEDGRFFSSSEDQFNAHVVVIGFNVAQILFPRGDAVGKTVKIMGRPFLVIGSIKKRGTMMMDFLDNQVYIPLNVFMNMYGSNRSITIEVKARNVQELAELRQETIGALRSIRNVPYDKEDDFAINESQNFRDILATFRTGIWAVGLLMSGLSFLVGIIGIMNIMFVSVTERTKEIGIRKAVGAKSASILFQFLVEAASLCFLGALIAFVLCSVLIFTLATIFSDITFLSPYIPPQLLLIASLVSLATGVLAGIIPAFRASRMNPVDALRYE